MSKIYSFWERLNKFERFDADGVRRGRLLNILLIGTVGLSSLALIIVLFVIISTSAWSEPGNAELLITLVVFILAGIGLMFVNQRSVRTASALFLSVLTLMFTFSDTPAEIANGRSSFVFFIPIAMASLLLAPASSFIFATIGGVISVALANVSGQIPNAATIISGFMLALVSWLSSRSLEQALRDLQSINANLDHLVEQKTRELTVTLSRELTLAGRNQAILDSIADGVIVFDAQQMSILANPALSRLTGATLKSLMGNNVESFLNNSGLSAANRGTIMSAIESPERSGESKQIQWGNFSLSLNTARVLNAASGENIGTVAVFRDITKEAELEKLKNTFVAMISHELRTPLNSILGYAEMLKDAIYGAINEEQSGVTERIVVNTKRLLSIVQDLLDEAQLKAGKLSIKKAEFKVSSLLETLHATLDVPIQNKGLTLTGTLDSAMPEKVTGDEMRLQQIVLNLTHNASKFTDKGGIDVRILRHDETHWRIEVADSGTGIPADQIPHIFETFRQVEDVTTRAHGGFGLGLAIVKQLVELMNGTISVESQLGRGSTFIITLPF